MLILGPLFQVIGVNSPKSPVESIQTSAEKILILMLVNRQITKFRRDCSRRESNPRPDL
jgi:hypothetical protein